MHVTSNQSAGLPAEATSFWRRFVPLWAIGLVGVFTLLAQPVPPELLAGIALDGVPEFAVRLLLLLNPMVLLTFLCAAGAATAHRVGLVSMAAGTGGQIEARAWVLSASAGAVLAAGIFLADMLWAPYLGAAWQDALRQSNRDASVRTLLLGVGYGGLAEEVMMRWGVMSAVAWGLARATGALRSGRTAPGWALATAAIVSALVFAAGHLPALAQISEPTGAIIARTLALNAVAGLLYGFCFWRWGLESAMLAHASSHAGFAVIRVVTV